MALFGRKKTDSVLPEVDKYYEGERRERTGLAWLLALVSVAIVALIIVGVFWTGRWTYRQLTKNNDNKVATETNNSDSTNSVPSFDGGSSDDSTSAQTDEQKAEEQKRTEEEAVRKQAEAEAARQKAAEEETRRVAQTTPKTGDDPVDLPRTGPADTVLLFGVVSTAAGAAHYVVARKRQG